MARNGLAFTGTLADRLARDSMPEPNSGCLLWTGGVDTLGYSHLRWRGAWMRGHRASWEAHRGPIPDGMHVLHKCDVRSCINPDHLFLGTHADNMRDRNEKGRAKSGQKPILNVAAAREIFMRPGIHRDIANEFGVCRTVVRQIKAGQKWARATADLREVS